jgi:hypothetical protein
MLNLTQVRAARQQLAAKKEDRASGRLGDRDTAVTLVDTVLRSMVFNPLEAVKLLDSRRGRFPDETAKAFRKAAMNVLFPATMRNRVSLAIKISAVEKLAGIVEAKAFGDFSDFVTLAAIQFGFADLLDDGTAPAPAVAAAEAAVTA